MSKFILNESKSKRLKSLEENFSRLGYDKALKALEMVKTAFEGIYRHNGDDYVTHLYDVALHLLNSGYKDEEILISALLHDTIEDVDGWNTFVIENFFSEKIAKTVALVTKEKGVNYKENEEKFRDYLSGALSTRHSALVKVADRVCNFQTMADSSSEHRERQLKETYEWFIPFIKEARELYPIDKPFYYQALSILRPLMKEVSNNAKLQKELNKYKEY